jgi:membrane protease YdiL (CAAX protease family)
MFGAFHVLGSYDSAIDLLYIIPYSIPGIVFASIMYKTKNICFPVFLHFVHNGLITSLNILLMLI